MVVGEVESGIVAVTGVVELAAAEDKDAGDSVDVVKPK